MSVKSMCKMLKLMENKETVWSDYFTQELLDILSFEWVDDRWECRSWIMELFMLNSIVAFVALPYFDDLVEGAKKIIAGGV